MSSGDNLCISAFVSSVVLNACCGVEVAAESRLIIGRTNFLRLVPGALLRPGRHANKLSVRLFLINARATVEVTRVCRGNTINSRH